MGKEPSPPQLDRIIKEEPIDDYEEPSRPPPVVTIRGSDYGVDESLQIVEVIKKEILEDNRLPGNGYTRAPIDPWHSLHIIKEEPPDDYDQSVNQEQPHQLDAPNEFVTVNGDENVVLSIECTSEPKSDAPLYQHQPDEEQNALNRSILSSDSGTDSDRSPTAGFTQQQKDKLCFFVFSSRWMLEDVWRR